MTQIEVNSQIADKLRQLSQQTKKPIDEILSYWLNNFGYTVLESDISANATETWTDEELAELLKPKKPLTGKQIAEQGLLGSWSDMGITDSVEWLESQRAKRRKKFEW